MAPKKRQGAPTKAERLKPPPGLYRSVLGGQVARIGDQELNVGQPSNADQEGQLQESEDEEEEVEPEPCWEGGADSAAA